MKEKKLKHSISYKINLDPIEYEAKKEKGKKSSKKYSKIISKLKRKKVTYRQGNPLKKIFKTKRGIVMVQSGGKPINLMKKK